jgi:NRPS condensation-like uncharacterized protein
VRENRLTSELRDLFPLPLVAFEKMMLLDDRESHPMTCGAEFTFAGHFDRTKLDAAFRRTCLRHPLFCAHVQQSRDNRWKWVAASELAAVRWIDDADAVAYERSAFMDLRSEVGLRMWAQTMAGGTKLLLDFHHACADGTGAIGFIEDLLCSYAALCGNCAPALRSLPAVDFSLLLRRGKFPRRGGTVRQRFKCEVSNACEATRFAIQRLQPLLFGSRPRLQVVPALPTRRLASVRFEAGFLAQLRANAASSGATVNDLLVRTLLLTIREWNRVHKSELPSDHLRILMPMNLRTRQDLEMPAVNRMSYATVTRNIAQLADPTRLLHAITQETSKLRRNCRPQRALSLLYLLDKVPRGISTLFSSDRCLATAVLSNVGDPTRRFRSRFPRDRGMLVVGDVLLTDFTAITPLRPLTRAAVFVNSYANRLTIASRLDPTLASPADATLLLDQFADRLATVAQLAPQARAA